MNNEVVVKNYYDWVDKCELEQIYSLFHPSIIYERANMGTALFESPIDHLAQPQFGELKGIRLAVFHGAEMVRDFYENGRMIKGRHFIETISADLSTISVGVIGHYNGHRIDDGTTLDNIRFRDFFKFNVEGKIIFRRSLINSSSKPL